MSTPEQIESALGLIRSLCHDKEGWEHADSEVLREDQWGADLLLTFHREDYVVCYVGMRKEQPLYVLQRIE